MNRRERAELEQHLDRLIAELETLLAEIRGDDTGRDDERPRRRLTLIPGGRDA